MIHKLGKKPANKRAKRLWLAKYINRSVLPAIANQDWSLPVHSTFPSGMELMLANGPDPANPPQIPDGVGDCFWAGETRDAIIRLAQAGFVFPTSFSAAALTMTALGGYSGCTGFDLNNAQATDNGTDALQGMSYLQNTGLTLPDGTLHKIGAVVWLNPQDFEELVLGSNYFGGLGIGVEFVGSWENETVWDATSDPVEGGHWIPAYSTVNVTPDGIEIDSWGEMHIITPAAFATKCDEVCVRIAPDLFGPNGKNIIGFDAEQLQADIAQMPSVSPS